MTKVTRFTMGDGGGAEKRRLHLREISGDSDAPLGTVGQDLRAARLRLGDDLASVSRVLKIRKDHLEALEEDRLESLPGRTYAVGFVRSYATYLGLDSDEYLERFKQEIAGRSENGAMTPYIDQPDRKLPQGWQAIALVVAGLLIYGIYLLASPSGSDSHPPVEPVPAGELAVPESPAPAPLAAQPAPAAVAAAPDPAPPAPEAAAPIPAAAPEPALPQGQSYGARNADARVILRARKPVFVSVRGPDGTAYLGRLLQPGDSYRVPNREGVIVNAADGGAVEYKLDAGPVTVLGEEGKPVEGKSLDPQKLTDKPAN